GNTTLSCCSPSGVSAGIHPGRLGRLTVHPHLRSVLHVVDSFPETVPDRAFGFLVLPGVDPDAFRITQQIAVDVPGNLWAILAECTVLRRFHALRPSRAVDIPDLVGFTDHRGRIVLVVPPFLRPAGDFVQPRELHLPTATGSWCGAERWWARTRRHVHRTRSHRD